MERSDIAHSTLAPRQHPLNPLSGTNLPLTLALPALKCGGKDREDAVILALVWAKLPEQKRQNKTKHLK